VQQARCQLKDHFIGLKTKDNTFLKSKNKNHEKVNCNSNTNCKRRQTCSQLKNVINQNETSFVLILKNKNMKKLTAKQMETVRGGEIPNRLAAN